MNNLFILIPLALCFGTAALITFLWTVKSGQYEDLDGAANRIFLNSDDEPAQPDKKDDVTNKKAEDQQPS